MTLPAAILATWGGLLWWRALRRAQGHTDGLVWPQAVPPTTPDPPSPSQSPDEMSLGRVRFNASVPRRRALRGKRPQ